MQKLILILALSGLSFTILAQVGPLTANENQISTSWSQQVDGEHPLPEYPRPQMVRDTWLNLNGPWDYAILPKEAQAPEAYDGKIIVPYPVESALSGVGKEVGSGYELWYNRKVTLPSTFKRKQVLLHFGAVDWQCDVFIDGARVGTHKGGYDPFSFDVTPYIKKGALNLLIRVWDPTDDGPQPRGKQVVIPHSIWYTSVTGIWQTVWLEAVPASYVQSFHAVPDVDAKQLKITPVVKNLQPGDVLKATAWDGTTQVAEAQSAGGDVTLGIPQPKLWSPSDPFLYDLKLTLLRKGKPVDEVKSYFGMRKISVSIDEHNIRRMLLNDEFVFQYGPLDQGWWPDGLYTAPTDEALRFDIEKTKQMGFNMIRKHVKVEPARWYYHCDKLGMLVWQDMPSGDMGNRWDSRPGILGVATDKFRTPESEAIYKTEWQAIIDALYNVPSIVVWVPFNEAWGQFKTEEITKWTLEHDPSRLVNSASGGNFYETGHILDLHNYPEPAMPRPDLFGKNQVLVLGEYGGLGLPIIGHTWQQKDNWGYQSFRTQEDLLIKYESFMPRLAEMIKMGLSAAVYTQTTDVEVEINGLMTYDRKIIKMPVDKLRQLHQALYDKSLVQIRK